MRSKCDCWWFTSGKWKKFQLERMFNKRTLKHEIKSEVDWWLKPFVEEDYDGFDITHLFNYSDINHEYFHDVPFEKYVLNYW